jgi:hypothetical protein
MAGVARTASLDASRLSRAPRSGSNEEAEVVVSSTAMPGTSLGGIVTRAIRSEKLWLTVGYVVVLLLLARAYA